jgi:hypothetical protein
LKQQADAEWVVANGNEIHDRPTHYAEDGSRIGDTPNLIAKVEYPYNDEAGQAANARLLAGAPRMAGALERIRGLAQHALHGDERRSHYRIIAGIANEALNSLWEEIQSADVHVEVVRLREALAAERTYTQRLSDANLSLQREAHQLKVERDQLQRERDVARHEPHLRARIARAEKERDAERDEEDTRG